METSNYISRVNLAATQERDLLKLQNITLKNLLNVLALGICFIITFTMDAARSLPDTSFCLQIEGKVLNAAENETHCRIYLMCGGTAVDSFILKDGKKKFKFVLKRNRHYAIKLTKAGYVDKIVDVDTKLEPRFLDFYSFSFETKLMPKAISERLNKQVLDQPIAMISFVEKKECFDYSKAYTTRIKKEMLVQNN